MGPKTRVGVILRESVGSKKGGKAASSNTSLSQLTEKYYDFSKRLRSLNETLHHHHASLVAIEKTRTALAVKLGEFTRNTPLYEAVGLMPSAERPTESVCSYASVHDKLSSKTKTFSDRYKQFVLDYCVEWERVIRTRIDNGIKKGQEMRRELDHYMKKVEALRRETNVTMSKGKEVKSGTAEKLRRNEEKLVTAKQSYNAVATQLSLLMEEVVERFWRDLHPVMLKCAQFDSALATEESRVLLELERVGDQLKQIGNAQGISENHRLKDLETKAADLLSTRPGGAESFSLAGSFTAGGEMAMPPGSVGAQGMGGFPLMISDSPGGSAPSSGNYQPPTDPFGGMTLSATPAPAPTLTDIYSSSGYSNNAMPTYGSAPNSAGLPPLGPPSNTERRRLSSAGSADNLSQYSGYNAPSVDNSYMSAPPMSAPPPPPSMPPPPPPMAGAMVMSVNTSSPYAPMNDFGNSYSQQPSYNRQQSNGSNSNPFGDTYGQPPSPNYGQPPSPIYGQPPSPNYGQPPSPNYGQPPSPSYGQPPSPSYGQPNNPYGGQPPSSTNPFDL